MRNTFLLLLLLHAIVVPTGMSGSMETMLFQILQARGPGEPAVRTEELQLVGTGLGLPSFNQLLHKRLLHFLVNGQVKKKNNILL